MKDITDLIGCCIDVMCLLYRLMSMGLKHSNYNPPLPTNKFIESKIFAALFSFVMYYIYLKYASLAIFKTYAMNPLIFILILIYLTHLLSPFR